MWVYVEDNRDIGNNKGVWSRVLGVCSGGVCHAALISTPG